MDQNIFAQTAPDSYKYLALYRLYLEFGTKQAKSRALREIRTKVSRSTGITRAMLYLMHLLVCALVERE